MTYEKMKDSGVPWIGEIPMDWAISRIKHKFSLRNERNYEPLEDVNLISLYTDKGVVQHSDLTETTGNKAVTADGYKRVCRNDIVVNIILCWMGAVGMSDYDGVTSPAYDVYQPKKETLSKYYHYLFRTSRFNGECFRYGRGIMLMRWRTYSEEFSAIKIPDPPTYIQQEIVRFLEAQCAQIDEIISEAQSSIDDYKRWKASVIYQAVTKGLNPDVEMRDSGFPWIGRTPVHWAVCRVKNALNNLDELREPVSAENRENKQGLYDYYGASGVIDKIDDFNVDDTVLLIGEDGANLRMRNLPLVYRASGKFWVNNHAHILKPKSNCQYGFAAYALEAGDYSIYITGAAQPKLTQYNLMRFPIVLPPIEEQMEIEAFLDNQCMTIDALIAEKQSLVTELESYRKSLIYEAVTGKRKVV